RARGGPPPRGGERAHRTKYQAAERPLPGPAHPETIRLTLARDRRVGDRGVPEDRVGAHLGRVEIVLGTGGGRIAAGARAGWEREDADMRVKAKTRAGAPGAKQPVLRRRDERFTRAAPGADPRRQ